MGCGVSSGWNTRLGVAVSDESRRALWLEAVGYVESCNPSPPQGKSEDPLCESEGAEPTLEPLTRRMLKVFNRRTGHEMRTSEKVESWMKEVNM